jgi:hypothetical protein
LKTENENNIKKPKKRSLFHKIINWFIGFFLGLFLLILIILGFTQTSLFRGILREQVIKIANSSLNGTVNIGKIDGTIFTSLLLSDVSVNMKRDTLLKAGLIEVRTSPLQLFYKKIFVRKVGIVNASFRLLKDEQGNLNISKLFKPKEEDTSKSSFPFKIKLQELALENVNFSLQDENKKYSAAFYQNLDMGDLRVSNINLLLSANADIDNNDFELFIKNFSFRPNISNFNVEQLKGDFLVNTRRVIIGGLELKTSRSEINLSIKNEGLNIFGDITKDSINNAKTDVLLDLKKFSFSDLSAVVPSLDFLRGDVEASLSASGNIKQVDIQKLELQYLDTKLFCSGQLNNLDAGSGMRITACFTKSNISCGSIPKLIAGLSVPSYKNMDNIRIDSLVFNGEPLNFKSRLAAGVNGGSVKTDLKIDLRPADIIYSVDLQTKDLNLEPVINIPSNLNIAAKISGAGFSTKSMKADVRINADGSSFNNRFIEAASLTAGAEGQFINFNLNALAGASMILLDGGLDMFDEKNPVYNINLAAEKLDLGYILGDSTLASSLNFNLAAKGKSFDIDKLSSAIKLSVGESAFKGYTIDKTEVNMAVENLDRDERSIKISSQFGNLSFIGRYSLKDISSLVMNDIAVLENQVFEKLGQSFPSLEVSSDKVVVDEHFGREDSTYVNFQVEFKDFSMLSRFFNSAQFDIDGKINGRYESGAAGMKLIFLTTLNYFQYWKDKDVLLINGLKANLTAENKNSASSIKDLNAGLDLAVERIFTGSDISNIDCSAYLKDDMLDISASGMFESKFSGNIAGQADINDKTIKLAINSLNFNYDKLNVKNSESILVDIYDNSYDIKRFKLKTGDALFEASGPVSLQGEQNLKMSLNNLKVKQVLAGLGRDVSNPIDALVSFSSDVTGTFKDPVISGKINVSGLTFKDKKFGALDCVAGYRDKNLIYDVKVIDTALQKLTPRFSMTGNLPVDLSFTGAEKRLLEDNPLKIKILFDEFNLASLGNLIPMISDIQGKVNADLSFEGTLNNLKKKGYLAVTDCSFFSDANYLPYNAGLKLSLSDDVLSFDRIFVENRNGVKNKGTLNAAGTATFNGYKINSVDIKTNGSLTVLTEDSKNSMPALYGELYMGIDGDALFSYDKGKMYVSAPIEIKKADLVFPPIGTGFRSYNEKFIYKYPVYVDSSKIGKKSNIEKIREAITQAAVSKTVTDISANNTMFDYDISIKIKDDAKIIFIVNKETNLRLVAELGGDIKYQNIDGMLNIFGELKLLDGSTLEFIKNLDATGSIRFESDITNPNLNILATYKSNYIIDESGSSQNGNEEEATIRIKIASTLKDLAKNIQSEDNVSIFTTADNFKNNVPDKSKGILDAAYFFLTNKFKLQDPTKSGLETTIAGNMLGSVLNSYLGDAVKSVNISTVGSNTVFNLTGKFGNFKYTIGGNSEVLQDLSVANIKVEHPIFENFLLRLERKQTLIESSTPSSDNMINELGLKYRFEF